jgi:hypothetical protein
MRFEKRARWDLQRAIQIIEDEIVEFPAGQAAMGGAVFV